MAVISYVDRCAFRPTTGGAGSFTVGASVTGYMLPAAAGIGDGFTYDYFAQSDDLTQWEYGTAVFSSSATVMARTVLGSSAGGVGGSAVNFTAAPTVGLSTLLSSAIRVINSSPDWVNVEAFGAVGDGSTDCTAAIQAAIDHAWAFNIHTIYIPSGTWLISSPLYLDAPGNLRSNFANPTIFNFSLTLIGDEGVGNFEGYGTIIQCTFNNTAAIYVGTGQSMMVANLTIVASDGGGGHNYHKQLNTGGIGIGICGGNGGASRTLFENIFIQSFYRAFVTGANGNTNLGDSNTWIKCIVSNAAIAWDFTQTQNFINNLFACQAGDFAQAINGSINVGVSVYGGNWSTFGAGIGVPLSSVSALSAIAHGNFNTYRFSVTISGPIDAGLNTNFANCIYNAFTIITTHFGIVPCVYISLVGQVLTLETTIPWSQFNFGGTDATTSTDLQNEIQAATKVYCCEWIQTFSGYVNVYNVHIESSQAAICLVDTNRTFGDNRPCKIDGVWFNYDPSLANLSGSSSDRDKALYYCSKTFPLVSVENDLDLRNAMFTCNDTVIFDTYPPGRLTLNMIEGLFVNYRVIDPEGNQFAPFDPNIPVQSLAETDRLTTPGNFAASYSDLWRYSYGGSGISWGWRPAAWTIPAILPVDYATLISGSLPAINNNGNFAAVSYPLLWGGQNYQVVSGLGSAGAANYGKIFYSAHNFYTYGQNLTTTQIPGLSWNYKGQSFVLNVSNQTMLFAGLGITLNDGSSDVQYVVTGQYPNLGYITVMGIASAPFQSLLSGTKTTIVTGSVIKQQLFSIVNLNQSLDTRVGTQFDKTDVTLANITNLTVPLISGHTYDFTAVLYCSCSAGGGAQVAIAGTATASSIRYGAKTFTGTTLNAQAQATALATAIGGSTSAVDRIDIDGTIVCNGTGTLTVQFAQNVASGTSSVLVGSSFIVRNVS